MPYHHICLPNRFKLRQGQTLNCWAAVIAMMMLYHRQSFKQVYPLILNLLYVVGVKGIHYDTEEASCALALVPELTALEKSANTPFTARILHNLLLQHGPLYANLNEDYFEGGEMGHVILIIGISYFEGASRERRLNKIYYIDPQDGCQNEMTLEDLNRYLYKNVAWRRSDTMVNALFYWDPAKRKADLKQVQVKQRKWYVDEEGWRTLVSRRPKERQPLKFSFYGLVKTSTEKGLRKTYARYAAASASASPPRISCR